LPIRGKVWQDATVVVSKGEAQKESARFGSALESRTKNGRHEK